MKTKLNPNRNIRGDVEILVVVAFILITTAFISLGVLIGTSEVKRKAVEAGCAHYEVDAKTGKTSFMWDVPTGTNSVAVPLK